MRPARDSTRNLIKTISVRFSQADAERLSSVFWKDRRVDGVAGLCRDFILQLLPAREKEVAEQAARELAVARTRESVIHFGGSIPPPA